MSLEPGTRLGDYKVLAPLGAGGMGEVYRARDPMLKRDVAIKVLPSDWSRDAERVRRFELEAQAAAALDHPNVVSIFHVGDHHGSPYIVTELLHGETLRGRLQKGPIPLREVLDLFAGVTHGLSAAHAAGIVHRDLKPENVFLTNDRRVKILDFGLAKLHRTTEASMEGTGVTVEQLTTPGVVLGTVGYMSPEQVRGEEVDARSDIFSVGVILYEMLTGTRAFAKATPADTLSAILNEDPPSLSQSVSNLPPGLQRIVIRCLAKNPEQRFQHAPDLAFAMDTLSDSSASAVSDVKHLSSARVRRSWIAAGVVAALVAGSAFWWNRPPAHLVVKAVTQLTDDGQPKPAGPGHQLATDGSRIYFNEGSSGNLTVAQVAASGGRTGVVLNGVMNQQLLGLSPDGSALLARSWGRFDMVMFLSERYPLWEIPLPAGEPRQLAGLDGQSANFAADGRILLARGGDLYLTEKDGSNSRTLIGGLDGLIQQPSLSRDGQRLVFTLYDKSGRAISILEGEADGSDLQPIVTGDVCCARWAPDGTIVFTQRDQARQDLWTLSPRAGFFKRSRELVQLTNGPLSYASPVVSGDGKQIFAIGTKQRGELVRYDMKTKQFVPFLSGISAFSPTFSRDGKWVAYTSYPDHTLWRSRSDGTDRLQLTYPPLRVRYPFISPDGKRVVYGTADYDTYVVSMDGGPPQRVLAKDSIAANWSPDGNLLVFTDTDDTTHLQLQIFDFRTGARSVVHDSQGLAGGMWVADDTLIATRVVDSRLMVFAVKTQKWSALLPATASQTFVNWNHSPDYQYLYYTTGGAAPESRRIRIADRRVETITTLKSLRQASGPDGNTQISVAPDGSPVFTRDIGTQEIYALTVK